MVYRKCMLCNRKSDETVTLFSFPANEESRCAWAQFCQVPVQSLKSCDKLCSLHFVPQAFKFTFETGRRAVLKSNALPTVPFLSDAPKNNCPPIPKYKRCEASSASQSANRKKHTCICCICGVVNAGTHRFRFPADPQDVQDWLKFCNMDPKDFKPKSHKLCIEHFTKEDFLERKTDKQRLLLKRGVKPSRMSKQPSFSTACNMQVPSIKSEMSVDISVEHNNDIDKQNSLNISMSTQPSCSSTPILPSNDLSRPIMDNSVNLPESCIVDYLTPKVEMEIDEGSASPHSRPSSPCFKRFPRYLNDIQTSDCGSSKTAKVILDIARRDLSRCRRQVDNLKHKNLRLEKENLALKKTLSELRRKLLE